MPEEIQAGVIECVSESLMTETSEVKADSKIITDLGADSLDFMDIIFSMESKFNIELDKNDFDLVGRLKMSREEAVDEEGNLTSAAKEKLVAYLPDMDINQSLTLAQLGQFITVRTLCKIVEEAAQ